ncbi:MAG: four helix bundle protein [Chitinophagaceae bacterium]
MNSLELQTRLRNFAYRVVTVCEALPKKKIAIVIEHQILRSSFSAAANYRAATKAQSQKSFVAKLSIAFEEIDESLFWLESIKDLNIITEKKLSSIIKETAELASILAAARKTMQLKLKTNINS